MVAYLDFSTSRHNKYEFQDGFNNIYKQRNRSNKKKEGKNVKETKSCILAYAITIQCKHSVN